MAVEASSSAASVVGHLITYFAAIGTGFLGGRIKDLVADMSAALNDVDDAASKAEKQLRLHALNQVDNVSLAEVFTARSHLGVILDRQFGRREKSVLDALVLFSDSLDCCDHTATGGLALGCDPTAEITKIRDNQQGLRHALSQTWQGKLAKFLGRKSLEN